MPKYISIQDARSGNLKNISVDIPRKQLVLITGVSGSGKSTLIMDTLYLECQRQYLESMGYQGIKKPKVQWIRNVSPAIQISQHHTNKNPRSSVGTATDIYTDLRMIYEKIGERSCPYCNKTINNVDCKEVLEKKKNGDFTVYMFCHHCGIKMEKFTRSHFSYNTMEGACPSCSGLGEELKINWSHVLDEEKSLEDGAIKLFDHKYNEYQIASIYKAFEHFHLPNVQQIPINQWTKEQRTILIHGVESEETMQYFNGYEIPKTVAKGKFEGLDTILWRKLAEKKSTDNKLKDYFISQPCNTCHGERLNETSRFIKVNETRLPELVNQSLDRLYQWIEQLELTLNDLQKNAVESYLLDIKTKLTRLMKVGLGYLSINRQTITLSGGELQKIKLAATLDSSLTGVLYLLDEPTAGLHPKDTAGMIDLIKSLRDFGNTVIIIEHDLDMIQAADYIIDIGPGSGKHGGEIVGMGTVEELKNQSSSITGQYLMKPTITKQQYRKGTGEFLTIQNATKHNLQQVSVEFPIHCLTIVTGASGSGKSTLVFDVLLNATGQTSNENRVEGLEQFNQIIAVRQASIAKMKRSNIVTFTEAFTEIRRIFSELEASKKQGFSSKHFSFNTPGGRCENCEGLGVVSSNMLFFEDVELTCPVCNGKRFKEEVLAVTWNDYSISNLLDLSVSEAKILFRDNKKLSKVFTLLEDVGLGYLLLGQPLTTLSGGEGQRLKLAKELLANKGNNNLFLIDEPTTGLHPLDIEHFKVLLDKIVEANNTIIVIEHNQQIIRSSDWIIELGPHGGENGGRVIATGTPEDIRKNKESIIGRYL